MQVKFVWRLQERDKSQEIHSMELNTAMVVQWLQHQPRVLC